VQVNNPLPISLALLALLVPGIVWLAWSMARRALPDAHSARFVTPGLALGLWLAALHVSAYTSGSFVTGLKVSTLALGILGYALATLDVRRVQAPPSRSGLGEASPDPRSLLRWDKSKIVFPLVPALATLLVAPMALSWAFHDEMFFTGHMSIASQMLNDVYPPHHLTFPSVELRYHYGFSLLCATLSAVARLPVESAVDFATLSLWFYTWCLLWLLGERLISKGWGHVTAALVLFGGGMTFFASPSAAPLEWSLLGLGTVENAILNPPMVSYFFQHPWTIGLPLGLCLVSLVVLRGTSGLPPAGVQTPPKAGADPAEGGCRPRLRPGADSVSVLAFALVVALAICQAVLFAALGVAVVVAHLVRHRGNLSRGETWVLPAAVGLAAALSLRLGGMFAPAPDDLGPEVVFDPGMADTLGGTLLWHVETYGFLLPFGIAGLWALERGRVLFGLLVLGSIGGINLVRHAHSWDMAKLALVGAIALSFLSAAAVQRAFARLRQSVLRWAAVWMSVGALTAAGLAFPVVFALDLKGIPESLFHKSSQALSPDDVKAVEWLRNRVKPDEVVYRRFPQASGYAQQGGIAQVWVDRMAARHGFSPERIQGRTALLRALPDDVQPYLREGIRYLVLEPDELVLNRAVVRWIATGQAEAVATFGRLSIVAIPGSGFHPVP